MLKKLLSWLFGHKSEPQLTERELNGLRENARYEYWQD